MSKKTNTVIFIIAATVFCTLVTVFCSVVFLIVYTKFIFNLIPEFLLPWILPIIFIASITVSFFIYRLAIKIITKKVNIEKYFAPIFGKQ